MKIDQLVNTRFKSSQQKALVNLRVTSNLLSNVQNQQMSKFDISMAQFNILRILRGAKTHLAVSTVKERMIEISPNTTRLMDKLLEKGLIERTRCEEDRRVVYIKISQEGLALLDQIDKEVDFMRSWSNLISDEEAESLSALLDKLRNAYVNK